LTSTIGAPGPCEAKCAVNVSDSPGHSVTSLSLHRMGSARLPPADCLIETCWNSATALDDAGTVSVTVARVSACSCRNVGRISLLAVGNACNAVRSAYSVYPRLGARPIAEVTAPEVLAVLRPIEGRGMNETAHRALQRCGQIFRYAIATGRATRDITSDLRGALAPVVVENRAAITEPAKIGALLRAIDDYIGHPMT